MDDVIRKIDIDSIMSDIYEKMDSRGYKDAPATFREDGSTPLIEREMKNIIRDYDGFEHAVCIRDMDEHGGIIYNGAISGGRIKRTIKKLVRRLVASTVLPLVDQANMYNDISYRAHLESFRYIHGNISELEDMRAEIRELRMQVERLETKLMQKEAD